MEDELRELRAKEEERRREDEARRAEDARAKTPEDAVEPTGTVLDRTEQGDAATAKSEEKKSEEKTSEEKVSEEKESEEEKTSEEKESEEKESEEEKTSEEKQSKGKQSDGKAPTPSVDEGTATKSKKRNLDGKSDSANRTSAEFVEVGSEPKTASKAEPESEVDDRSDLEEVVKASSKVEVKPRPGPEPEPEPELELESASGASRDEPTEAPFETAGRNASAPSGGEDGDEEGKDSAGGDGKEGESAR